MIADAKSFSAASVRGAADAPRLPQVAGRPLAEPLAGTLSVRAVGVGKSIEERPILRGINLEIPRGGFVALLGANGAGKSTFLKILSTLSPPSSGTLELFGISAHGGGGAGGSVAIRKKLGLIGHQTMLYHDLSAIENLEFFGKLYGVEQPRKRGMELLEILGLAHRAQDAVKAFSRGMAQRVGIARALMHDPELLLADEPFAGLDAPSTAMLERVLADLHSAGKTIVLANHDIRQSLRLSERAVMLVKGEKVIDAAAADLDPAAVLARMEGTGGGTDAAKGRRGDAARGDDAAKGRQGDAAKNESLAASPRRRVSASSPLAASCKLLRQVGVLTAKDLRIEGRTRQTMGLVLVLGILIVTVLGLGLQQMSRETVRNFTPAMLWVAYLFGGVLCFEKTMAVERQDGALAGLLLGPLDRGAIFAAKLISNLILMFSTAAVTTAVGLLFFGFDLSPAPGGFILVIAVSMLGFAAVGTLFAALVSSTKLQGGLLAMVIFPVILPLVIASTQQVTVMFRDGASPGLLGPDGTINGLGILLAFDAIFLVASWLMFELILEP